MSLLFAGAAAAATNVIGPSIRASATFSANTNLSTFTQFFNVTIPATAQVGDVLIIANSATGGSTTTPSGWTRHIRVVSESFSGATRTGYNVLEIWTKVCQSGDPGSTVALNQPSAKVDYATIVLAIQNCPTSTPSSISSYENKNASSTSWTLPGPVTYVGKKPARIEFFGQSHPTGIGFATPTFSNYSGNATFVATSSTNGSRLNCYFNDDTKDATSASISSSLSGPATGVAFALRGI